MLFHAHSANAVGIWHPLFDHLTSVSRLAREFAVATPWADEARLSGLLHDLGKYRYSYQHYIRQVHDPTGHIEGWAGGRDKTHSTAGGLWPQQYPRKSFGPQG
ncbi:hypothetical protein PG1C_12190 [Rugosibacter aromaticivorans]|uniref:HD Cas3-type domain-containing protein n=1 Tax=Rugosibacter aromaticivorans TaxID=1565605 RepID=A0A0C5J1H7_9PROT|nr:hypothetical protein [Rugosibacter aromaticivorans]AJP48977.1 hypothetical protein PG1C_12190 [Rugosibacter aromaticivorans]